MFGKQYLLTKQLVTSAALALCLSGIALADDNSMNPAPGDVSNGQNRGNPNMIAQNPRPMVTESAGTRQKKDEQKIDSKSPAYHGRYLPSPGNNDHNYYSQFPGE
jgi:hypothetical protein